MSEQESLFTAGSTSQSPLAQQMRPRSLDKLIGQTHFLNERFRRILASDKWTGFIFWGPPGTGKTTLATLIAEIDRRSGHPGVSEVLPAPDADVGGLRARPVAGLGLALEERPDLAPLFPTGGGKLDGRGNGLAQGFDQAG